MKKPLHLLLRRKVILYPLMFIFMAGFYFGMLQLTGNFHEIIPGELYRSGQLSGKRLTHYADTYGIKAVINLRGDNTGSSWYDEELKAARQADLQYINFRMSAGKELTQAKSLQLIELMRNAPKPLLIHCKAGADRTGLASALYMASIVKASEHRSEMQLSFIYGHLPFLFGRTRAMDNSFQTIEPLFGFEKN